jgi:hypothetical protein
MRKVLKTRDLVVASILSYTQYSFALDLGSILQWVEMSSNAKVYLLVVVLVIEERHS